MDDSPARYRPYLAMLLLFLIALAGTVFVLRRPEPAALTIIPPIASATPTPALVLVDVRGAVAKPGVYRLPLGSRVQDALTLAGNTLDNADTRPLNFARKLNDGEQIYISVIGEATPPPVIPPGRAERPPTPTKTPFGKININTATVSDLDLLPGIGPSIWQRIADYRDRKSVV
jgi:competence protein ComEA